MKNNLTVLLLIFVSLTAFGQQSSKIPKYLSKPIIVDSMSVLIIPVRYNVDFFASSKKIGYDYYANIIFYNFKTDSSKKLFTEDKYIKEFSNYNSRYLYDWPENQNNICKNWIFYFVKSDYDKNGKIDYDDPCVLYVSDKQGNGLKSVTAETENAVSINIFENQGFALIRIQRNSDGDKGFDYDDKDFYYIRLDLATLALGHKIELK